MADALTDKVYEYGLLIGGEDPRDAQRPYRTALSSKPDELLSYLGADDEALEALRASSKRITNGGRPFVDPRVERATQRILKSTGFWDSKQLNLPASTTRKIVDGAVTVAGAVPDLPQVSYGGTQEGARQVRINRVLGDRIAEKFDGNKSEVVYDATTISTGQMAVARAIDFLAMPWAEDVEVTRLRGLTWTPQHSDSAFGKSPMEQAVIGEVYTKTV